MESFKRALRLFFKKELLRLWIVIIIYISLITYGFYNLSFWENIYLKTIIFWFIFSGLINIINSEFKDLKTNYFKYLIKRKFNSIIFVNFILNTFTFNIIVELFIIPIVSILTIFSIYIKNNEAEKQTYNFLNKLIVVITFIIYFGTFLIAVQEYKQLNLVVTLINFLLPIIYGILIVPLEYLIEVYIKYDTVFRLMKFKEKNNKKVSKKYFWEVFKICKLSFYKISNFDKNYRWKMYNGLTYAEFYKILEEFKEEVK